MFSGFLPNFRAIRYKLCRITKRMRFFRDFEIYIPKNPKFENPEIPFFGDSGRIFFVEFFRDGISHPIATSGCTNTACSRSRNKQKSQPWPVIFSDY